MPDLFEFFLECFRLKICLSKIVLSMELTNEFFYKSYKMLSHKYINSMH